MSEVAIAALGVYICMSSAAVAHSIYIYCTCVATMPPHLLSRLGIYWDQRDSIWDSVWKEGWKGGRGATLCCSHCRELDVKNVQQRGRALQLQLRYICTYTYSIYVCMHICLCMYICIYMCIHTYICIYKCMHTYICIHMCLHTYICIYMHVYIYVCVYICTLMGVGAPGGCVCVCVLESLRVRCANGLASCIENSLAQTHSTLPCKCATLNFDLSLMIDIDDVDRDAAGSS